MTFLEICQRVRQDCSIQGTGPASVTDQSGLHKQIVDWVATSDREIQLTHPDWTFLWKTFTEDTISGVSSITRPADLSLWDRESFTVDKGTTTGKPLDYIPYEESRKTVSLLENTAPIKVTILPNQNLSLIYPADDAYSFSADYWKNPVCLETNTQVSDIPEDFHRVIVERARMFFYEDIESFDQYKLAEYRYKDLLTQLEARYLPTSLDHGQYSPEQIVVRPV